MQTLTAILSFFFTIFLLGFLIVSDPFILFLTIFLGTALCVICLINYLGKARGIFLAVSFFILPFLLEYLLYIFRLPYFNDALIKYLSFSRIYLPLTLSNLFKIFILPLLFSSALIFAQKIRLFTDLKKFPKTITIILSSILIAINPLVFSSINWQLSDLLKWFILGLLVNILLSVFFKFQGKAPDIYKEVPIILYLGIYTAASLKILNSPAIIAVMFLTIFYLMILYKEYKLKKITANF